MSPQSEHHLAQSHSSTRAAMSFDETTTTPDAAHSPPRAALWQPPAAPVSPCCSESSASCMAPQVAASFRNVEDDYAVNPHVLGTGKFGSVRSAVHRATGQRYAVKSVRKDSSAVSAGSLAREAGFLRELDHPGIVRLVGVYEDDLYVHLVTDLCAGGELFDLIAAGAAANDGRGAPCVAEDEASRIIAQLLEAVAHLHARGIVHRDIKPENVLFASPAAGSPIKLVDFGLARRPSRRPGAPKMRSRVGTPYYMAPEVLRRRAGGYGPAVDVWAVGVIAHLLIVGYPPFNGRDDDEIFAATRKGRPIYDKDDWASASREAQDFVRRLLRRSPGARPTAAQALEHPWIRRHAAKAVATGAGAGEFPHDLSVEVVYHRSRSDSIIMSDGETDDEAWGQACR